MAFMKKKDRERMMREAPTPGQQPQVPDQFPQYNPEQYQPSQPQRPQLPPLQPLRQAPTIDAREIVTYFQSLPEDELNAWKMIIEELLHRIWHNR